jgi:hypothetical protein
MGRYKTRAELNRETLAARLVRYRKALSEIRDILGLKGKIHTDDIVEAVRALVKKDKENSDDEQGT